MTICKCCISEKVNSSIQIYNRRSLSHRKLDNRECPSDPTRPSSKTDAVDGRSRWTEMKSVSSRVKRKNITSNTILGETFLHKTTNFFSNFRLQDLLFPCRHNRYGYLFHTYFMISMFITTI